MPIARKTAFVVIVLALGIACGLLAMPANATHAADDHATVPCAGVMASTIMASEAEHRLICAAAETAINRLDQCAIALKRPLSIKVSEVVRSPFGTTIFGRFDGEADAILVTRTSNIEPLIGDTPYRELPLPDFYMSLIVHEVVHAAMHQNYRRQPTSRAAYEYPAYALQLETMMPAVRSKLLTTNRGHEERSILFNDMILSFDPFLFAARAYEHFAAPGQSCSRLQTLLDGDADFIITLPF